MLLPLLQAISIPGAPTLSEMFRSLTPFILIGLTWMQARGVSARTKLDAQIESMQKEVRVLRDEVTVLNTHVGVEGNGIIAKLDAMAHTLDEIRNELAENRGANRTRGA